MVLKQFREGEEEGCFLLSDPVKYIKRKGGEILEWISRSNKKYNLTAARASKSFIELPNGRYALNFQKSCILMIIVNLALMGMCAIHSIHNVTTNRPSLQIMILQIPLYLMKYHLLTRKNIYGDKKMQNPHIIIIQHTCRDWTTLFIE